MIIKDEIGEQVKYSLKAAKLAQSNVLHWEDSILQFIKRSKVPSRECLLPSSIISVSYFSYEHCFAVYSPFFLPVAGHVVLAALQEWKRYKQQKAKDLTWLTRMKTA